MLRRCSRTVRSLVVCSLQQARCQHATRQATSKLLATSHLHPQQHITPSWCQRSYSTEGNTEVEEKVHVEETSVFEEVDVEETSAVKDTSAVDEVVYDTSAVNEVLSQVSIERASNIQQQEKRMNFIRIHGLDTSTKNSFHLKEQVRKLFTDMGVRFDNKEEVEIPKIGLSGDGSIVVCRLAERRYVNYVLSHSANLRRIPELSHVRVDQQLCSPYNNIKYHLRMLRREKKIARYGVYNGTNQLKLQIDDEWTIVTHIHDLVELGLLKEDDA